MADIGIRAIRATLGALAGAGVLYAAFLSLLTIPYFQNQVIYLHHITLTGSLDVNVPEQWGFLRNQVTPFTLDTPDGETLHAWHVVPLGLYQKNEPALLKEDTGLVPDIKQRLSFQLLRDDPDALLVLYFHGAAGTLASGWRPQSYRALHAGAPNRIHVVAIDYRGFGSSTGVPSEDGLLIDALTLAEWAMKEAGIPPSRIILWAQSLGTAVAVSLAEHLAAAQPEPTLFAGMVLVAPFADVELLTATYRVGGTIPLLDPVARVFPGLLAWLNTFILSKWPSKEKLASFVRRHEQAAKGETEGGGGGGTPRYHVTIIHCEDDYDIPWAHSEKLYWHAVNATVPAGISFEELEAEKEASRTDLGSGGWVVKRETERGTLTEHILRYGLHDRIMSYPVVSLAALRAFGI